MTIARIKKGDMVQVTSGRERGKSGIILEMLTQEEKALVEHLNRMKRHVKAKSQKDPGGIIEKEAPLPLSVLMPFCPKCNKGVRVKVEADKEGNKIRLCSRCGEGLDSKGKKK